MSVSIVFDKDRYTGGDAVGGHILLDIRKETHFNQVSLFFEGWVDIGWKEQVGNRIYHYGARKNITSKQFILTQLPVESILPPGQHRFPFSFELEHWYPPSFRVGGAGGVFYNVKAVVQRQGMLTSNLRMSGNIHLDSPLDIDLFKQRIRLPAIFNVLGVEDKVAISLFLDRNVVSYEEPLRVHVIVDNQTRNPVKTVTFEAFEEILIHFDSWRRPSRRRSHVCVEFDPVACEVAPFEMAEFTVHLRWPQSVRWTADYTLSLLDIHHELRCRVNNGRSRVSAMPVFLLPQSELSRRLIAATPNPQIALSPLFARPPWAPDESADVCRVCGSAFSFVRRRHHCRMDGHLVCAKCSKSSILMPPAYRMAGQRRVCDTCAPDALQGRIPQAVLQEASERNSEAAGNFRADGALLPPEQPQMSLPPSLDSAVPNAGGKFSVAGSREPMPPNVPDSVMLWAPSLILAEKTAEYSVCACVFAEGPHDPLVRCVDAVRCNNNARCQAPPACSPDNLADSAAMWSSSGGSDSPRPGLFWRAADASSVPLDVVAPDILLGTVRLVDHVASVTNFTLPVTISVYFAGSSVAVETEFFLRRVSSVVWSVSSRLGLIQGSSAQLSLTLDYFQFTPAVAGASAVRHSPGRAEFALSDSDELVFDCWARFTVLQLDSQQGQERPDTLTAVIVGLFFLAFFCLACLGLLLLFLRRRRRQDEDQSARSPGSSSSSKHSVHASSRRSIRGGPSSRRAPEKPRKAGERKGSVSVVSERRGSVSAGSERKGSVPSFRGAPSMRYGGPGGDIYAPVAQFDNKVAQFDNNDYVELNLRRGTDVSAADFHARKSSDYGQLQIGAESASDRHYESIDSFLHGSAAPPKRRPPPTILKAMK